MKYFSMFSGIGGFELGILYSQQTYVKKHGEKEKELAWRGKCNNETLSKLNSSSRLSCVGYSEIDKYAIKIYQKHFKGHKNYGDATNIFWSEVEDFDLFVGGFPCQAFSIAGKRRGFSDTRGTMFFQIARALREKQPCFCVLENVKGLLSHDKGQTFATILTTLSELGYDAQWQVLNSKNYGVPQNRERVFIIGHLRGKRRPEVFPIRQRNRLDNKTRKEKKQKIQTFRCLEATEYKGYSSERFDGILEGVEVRRLTPTECERLQGFPDGWTEGVSDTQRYKCLGNAVTVNVIEAIIKELFNDKK